MRIIATNYTMHQYVAKFCNRASKGGINISNSAYNTSKHLYDASNIFNSALKRGNIALHQKEAKLCNSSPKASKHL